MDTLTLLLCDKMIYVSIRELFLVEADSELWVAVLAALWRMLGEECVLRCEGSRYNSRYSSRYSSRYNGRYLDMYRPAGGRVVVKVLGDGVAGGVPGQPALAVPVILVRRTEHIRAWHRYVDIDM